MGQAFFIEISTTEGKRIYWKMINALHCGIHMVFTTVLTVVKTGAILGK